MVSLPSLDYRALNAPGGLFQGFGGLAEALVQAPQEHRRLQMAGEDQRIRREGAEANRRYQAFQIQQGGLAQARQQEEFKHKKEADAAKAKLERERLDVEKADKKSLDEYRKNGAGRNQSPHSETAILGSLDKQVEYERERRYREKNIKNTNPLGWAPLTAEEDAQILKDVFGRAGRDPYTRERIRGGLSGPAPEVTPEVAPQKKKKTDAELLQMKSLSPRYQAMDDASFIQLLRSKGL